MKELSLEEILNLADNRGLNKCDRCLEHSGYPRTNRDGIITGFTSFEMLQEFIEDIGMGEPSLFKRKDGWHRTFQYYVGYMDRPLSAYDYVRDLGDNYNLLYDIDTEIQFAKEIVNEMLDNKDLDAAYRYLIKLSCLKDEWDNKGDDEIIIMTEGELFETVKKEMMRYCEDTWTYEVGVYIPYFEIEENEY